MGFDLPKLNIVDAGVTPDMAVVTVDVSPRREK